jgi:hypothetical protein
MDAIKYSTSVLSGGKIELDDIDMPEGTPVEVIVLAHGAPEQLSDPLAAASESSMAFWDNPIDDEVWNSFQ